MSEAARRDHFPQVRVVRFCGEGGASAEQNRVDAALSLRLRDEAASEIAPTQIYAVAQWRPSTITSRVRVSTCVDEQAHAVGTTTAIDCVVKRRPICVIAIVRVRASVEQGGHERRTTSDSSVKNC